VLIPRPETEFVVQAGNEILDGFKDGSTARVLELGTGSGAIIVSLAAEHPDNLYFAVDRSADALNAAIRNARAHLSPGAVRFFRGSWLGACHIERARFELIVSNPPYIRQSCIEKLQTEIAAFEPREALDGGPEGMDALREILSSVPAFLSPGGWLLLEIGHDQRNAIEHLVESQESLNLVGWQKDLAGHSRVVIIRKKGLRTIL
jgi:release factor glutamine methyltransferase